MRSKYHIGEDSPPALSKTELEYSEFRFRGVGRREAKGQSGRAPHYKHKRILAKSQQWKIYNTEKYNGREILFG